MASIKDALEESVSDGGAWIKFVLYSIPVFITYALFSIGNMSWFWIAAPITGLLLLTILSLVINNVRNGKNYSLPSFNPFEFAATFVKLIFAMGPVCALCSWAAFALSKIPIPVPIPNIQLVYSIIVWLIFGAIMLTSLMNFSKTQKITDAYDMKVICDSCVEVLVAFLFYIPQILFVNGIFFGVVCYLFGIFWSLNNNVFIFICAMAIVINITITGNYLAQMDYETMVRNNNNTY